MNPANRDLVERLRGVANAMDPHDPHFEQALHTLLLKAIYVLEDALPDQLERAHRRSARLEKELRYKQQEMVRMKEEMFRLQTRLLKALDKVDRLTGVAQEGDDE
jgi:hypothetical protein